MKRFLSFSHDCLFLFFLLFFLCHQPGSVIASIEEEDKAPGIIMADQAVKEKQLWITTDHSKHDILKKEFTSGPEVTKACLSCHTEAALQFHKTRRRRFEIVTRKLKR